MNERINKNILITGAAGGLGKLLRNGMFGKYNLVRCLDRVEMDPGQANEQTFVSDLSSIERLKEAMSGIDVVVHLAGSPNENTWENILESNIEGCYNVFEAARLAGVKRFIFASSNHAIGFYSRNERIDSRATMRPDSRYGVSKVLGEALGRLYSDKHGMEVVCLRIGSCNPQNRPMDFRQLSTWMSHRDWVHLVESCIEHPGFEFEVVYGASNNTRAIWDNSLTCIHYRPQDDAEAWADEFGGPAFNLDIVYDPIAELYHGGAFCSAEYSKNK